jgi:PHD/YefM family antitoxin component YafN of YafNO toxin-antitoxin module
MNKITLKETDPILSSLIDKVNESHEATLITVDHNKQAILLSVEEWNSIQETLYLLSIPGVKEDLIQGKNTEWEDCTPLEKVEW